MSSGKRPNQTPLSMDCAENYLQATSISIQLECSVQLIIAGVYVSDELQFFTLVSYANGIPVG